MCDFIKRQQSIDNRLLLLSARRGEFSVVSDLIDKGVDINFLDSDGNSALHYAIEGNHLDIIEFLLKKNINFMAPNNQNETSFEFACKKGNKDVISVLETRLLQLTFEIFDRIEECRACILFGNVQFQSQMVRYWKIKDLVIDYIKTLPTKKTNKKLHVEVIDQSQLISIEKANVIFYVKNNNKWIEGKFEREADEDTVRPIRPLDLVNYCNSIILFENNPPICFMKLFKGRSSGIILVKRNISDTSSLYVLEVLAKLLPHRHKKISELQDLINSIDFELIKQDCDEIKNRVDAFKLTINTRLESLGKIQREIIRNENNMPKEELKYRKANFFLYFLEAFSSFCSTFEKITDNSCFDEERDEKIRILARSYFVKQEDFKLITDVRTKLLHKPKKRIDLKDIENFFACEKDITVFFDRMVKYVEYMKNQIENDFVFRDQNLSCFLKNFIFKEEDASKFLKFMDHEKDKKNMDDFFSDSDLVSLIHSSYKNCINEQVRFHFLVNFYPVFERKLKRNEEDLKELKELRNKLIHEFYKQDETEFRKQMSNVKELLFKYLYADKIYQEFDSLSPEDTPEGFRQNFEENLSNYNKKIFVDDYYVSEEDAKKNDGGLLLCKKAYGPREDNINDFVKQYLNCMIIFDDNKDMTNIERRKIFEDFEELKWFQNKNNIEMLKTSVGKFNVKSELFEAVIKTHFKANVNEKKNATAIAEITSTVKLLINISKRRKLSVKEICEFYDSFMKNEKKFNEKTECKPVLRKDFELVRKNYKQMTFSIGKYETTIDAVAMVQNILDSYLNSYNIYKLDFSRIKEAFNDDALLNFLVCKFVKSGQTANASQFRDEKKSRALIQAILNWEYTAPFIAKLESKVEKGILGDDEWKHLITILLAKKDGLFAGHLMSVIDNKVTKEKFFRTFCEDIETELIVIDNLGEIFKRQEIIHYIFSLIKENIKEPNKEERYYKILKIVVKILNKIILQLRDHKRAKQILTDFILPMYELLREKENINDDLEYVEIKLKEVRMDLLCFNKSEEKEKEKYALAEKKLKLIKKILKRHKDEGNRDVDLRLLYLRAHIHHIQKRYIIAQRLWLDLHLKIMSRFSSYIISLNELTTESYRKIAVKEDYTNLLKKSEDNRKDFDILRVVIKRADTLVRMGASMKMKDFISSSALELYQKIREIRKDMYGDDYNDIFIRRKLAKANIELGNLCMKDAFGTSANFVFIEDLNASLQHYYVALLHFCIIFEIHQDKFGVYDPETENIERNMKIILLQILNIYRFLSNEQERL